MKIINAMKLHKTGREVQCPNGGFTSIRMLLEKDKMGFTMTRTTIHPGDWQWWHYKHHLEACYCIKGSALLKNEKTGEVHEIKPGICYALDKHDPHLFKATETTILICVFNPPLTGLEVHQKDGSYSAKEK